MWNCAKSMFRAVLAESNKHVYDFLNLCLLFMDVYITFFCECPSPPDNHHYTETKYFNTFDTARDDSCLPFTADIGLSIAWLISLRSGCWCFWLVGWRTLWWRPDNGAWEIKICIYLKFNCMNLLLVESVILMQHHSLIIDLWGTPSREVNKCIIWS